MKNNIAIITARSGSKGLKDKNIRPLLNKPLMAYSIEAAVQSGLYSTVMVSTDSEKYADIAVKYGAEVPFLRSCENSNDKASSWDTVREVLLRYKDFGKTFDMLTLLQPTSPLRLPSDLIGAYDEFVHKKATAVVSVCETEHSPLWCNILPDSLSMQSFLSNENNVQRQKMLKYFRLNGAIYMLDCEHFEKTSCIYDEGCYAYIMSQESSVDIDTEVDFLIAEAIMKYHIKEDNTTL